MVIYPIVISQTTTKYGSSTLTNNGFYSSTQIYTGGWNDSITNFKSFSNGLGTTWNYSTGQYETNNNGDGWTNGESGTSFYSYSQDSGGATEQMDGGITRTNQNSWAEYDDADPPNITSTGSSSGSVTYPQVVFWGRNIWPFSWSNSYSATSSTPDTRSQTINDSTTTTSSRERYYNSAALTDTTYSAYTTSSDANNSMMLVTTSIDASTVTDASTYESSYDWGDYGSGTYEAQDALSTSTSVSYLCIDTTSHVRANTAVDVYGSVLICEDGETGYIITKAGVGLIDDLCTTFTQTTLSNMASSITTRIIQAGVDASSKVTLSYVINSLSYSSSEEQSSIQTYTTPAYAYSVVFPEDTTTQGIYWAAKSSSSYWTTSYTSYTNTAKASFVSVNTAYTIVGGNGSLFQGKNGLEILETSMVQTTTTTTNAGCAAPISYSQTGTLQNGGYTNVSNCGATYDIFLTWEKSNAFVFTNLYGQGAVVVGKGPVGAGRHLPMDMVGTTGPASTAVIISADQSVTWMPFISNAWKYWDKAPVSYPKAQTGGVYKDGSYWTVTVEFSGNTAYGTTQTTTTTDSTTAITTDTVSAVLQGWGNILTVNKYREGNVISAGADGYGLVAGVYKSVAGSGELGEAETVSHATTKAAHGDAYIEPIPAYNAMSTKWVNDYEAYRIVRHTVTTPNSIY
jgi:hypothetical protein